jgi:hypothetical protein
LLGVAGAACDIPSGRLTASHSRAAMAARGAIETIIARYGRIDILIANGST